MGPLGEESAPHPVDAERVRALSARAARWVSSASYLKKWTVLGVVIGAVAGLGAIVFYEALVALHPPLLGRARRLPGADASRRGRSDGVRLGGSSVGTSPCCGRRSTARSDTRLPLRPRSQRPRHRCGDLGRAPQPPWRPLPSGDREDRGLGPHHRIGGLGRARGADRVRSVPASGPLLARCSISNPPTAASPWRRASARASGPSSARPWVVRCWLRRSSTATISNRPHFCPASSPRR